MVCRWAFQLDESVFEKLQQGEDIGTVVFKQWADNDELEACILQTLSEELGLKDVGDQDGFDRSLGGNVTERELTLMLGVQRAQTNGKYSHLCEICPMESLT